MKIAMFAHFKDYHGNHKKILRVYMVLVDAVLKLETDLQPYFKVYNMIFYVVVSDYRLVKI